MDAPAVLLFASCRSSLAAGFNPLMDAASSLFSLAGRLKVVSLSLSIDQLQKECIREITVFEQRADNGGYRTDYVFVGRYVLCAMLDDIMAETAWGRQGLWQAYRLSTVFHPESSSEERFFLILQRILKDPIVYMDLMELMYVCLSLGYKGVYRNAGLDDGFLNNVTSLLYKQIRVHHGESAKNLSPALSNAPYCLKKEAPTHIAYGQLIVVTLAVIMLSFVGFSYGLDVISSQAYSAMGNHP